MKTIHAIIPACNESNSVEMVVRAALRFVDECIVVDDGSKDNTALRASKAGARVLRLAKNKGSGVATKIGLHYSLTHGAAIVCLLDADGQHDPENLPRLIKEVNNGADLVIASRYIAKTKHATSRLRHFGTWVISFFMGVVYRRKFHDPTSGYRAMNRRTLNFITDRYPVFFSEPEVIIDLIHHGFIVREVSVEMHPRKYGASSISVVHSFRLFMHIFTRMLRDIGI